MNSRKILLSLNIVFDAFQQAVLLEMQLVGLGVILMNFFFKELVDADYVHKLIVAGLFPSAFVFLIRLRKNKINERM